MGLDDAGGALLDMEARRPKGLPRIVTSWLDSVSVHFEHACCVQHKSRVISVSSPLSLVLLCALPIDGKPAQEAR